MRWLLMTETMMSVRAFCQKKMHLKIEPRNKMRERMCVPTLSMGCAKQRQGEKEIAQSQGKSYSWYH